MSVYQMVISRSIDAIDVGLPLVLDFQMGFLGPQDHGFQYKIMVIHDLDDFGKLP